MGFAAICVEEFRVQAVVRGEPGLRGCAVALIEGVAPLRSVVAVNEAGLRAGIEMGMTESQCEDFCAVQVRVRSLAQEKAAHAALMDVGWSVSPRVEDTAADTIVVDVAGLASLFGSEEMIAAQLRERAAGLGLEVRVAVSRNLETAIHAARGFAGITLIPEGEEAKWLGGLPVSVLLGPDEISAGAEILATLESWGVRTCEGLARLPVLELSERLGQEGVRLHELARGARERALVLAEPDIYFEEEMELEDAVPELEPLSFLLGRLLDQLCARLEARSLGAVVIRVRFELEPVSAENFRTLNDSLAGKAAPPVYEKTLTLPVPMRNSKMLLKLLRLRLQAEPPQTAVVKLFMAAEAARSRFAQGGLFLPSAPDPEKLELTIARLANLVGEGNVGAAELADTHRPDAFRVRKFASPGTGARAAMDERARLRGTKRKSGAAAGNVAAEHDVAVARDVAEKGEREPRVRRGARTSFRVFRPALPATVELREGRIARVSFSGMRGEALAASGPWRTSGDWWREDGWEQDEWDVEIGFGNFSSSTSLLRGLSRGLSQDLSQGLSQGLSQDQGKRSSTANLSSRKDLQPAAPHGLYRIYYDAVRRGWFVRGMYD